MLNVLMAGAATPSGEVAFIGDPSTPLFVIPDEESVEAAGVEAEGVETERLAGAGAEMGARA